MPSGMGVQKLRRGLWRSAPAVYAAGGGVATGIGEDAPSGWSYGREPTGMALYTPDLAVDRSSGRRLTGSGRGGGGDSGNKVGHRGELFGSGAIRGRGELLERVVVTVSSRAGEPFSLAVAFSL